MKTIHVGNVGSSRILIAEKSIMGYMSSYARGIIKPGQLEIIAKEIISDARRQRLFTGPILIDFVGNDPTNSRVIYPNEGKYMSAIDNLIAYITGKTLLPL